MKKAVFLLAMGLALLSAYSCEDTTVTEIYAMGINAFEGDGHAVSDLAAVTEYLKGKGAIVESKVIEAKSTDKADNEAIELWDKNVKLIDETEMALLVKGKFSFKYCLVRAVGVGSVDNPVLREKEYKFNQ
mgnify:CR=1 FL=1